MKRNLLAVFLAVMVLSALVFVVAPNAKAEESNFITAEADQTYNISKNGMILDLNGQKNVTINVAENITLSVIDSANMEMDGSTAGSATISGNVSNVTLYQNYRYLKVANTDKDGNLTGTYSFHPFNMTFTKVGINTLAGENNDSIAISLRATFIANDVVKSKLTDYGVYNKTLNQYSSVKGNYPFSGNGLHAFGDLMGSLDTSVIDSTNTVQVYMQFGDDIHYSAGYNVTPREILKKINKDNVTPTDAQKGRLDELFKTNTRVANILTNMQTTTKDEIVTGTLTFVEGNRVASSGTQQTWQQNGVTLIYYKGSYNQSLAEYANPARFYAGTKLTVNMTGMTQIVFDCNSGTYATALKTSIGTVSGATVSVSSDKVTVTFTNAVDSFAVAELTAQVRMDSMTVTATKTITNIVTCKHGTNLSEATCSKQAVCIDCDQPYGETTDHDTIAEATCTTKAQCSVCGEYGETIPHNTIAEATCIAKAQCDNCGEYGEVDVNNHTSLSEATCQAPIHCSGCGIDIGDVVDCKDTDGDGLCNWCLTNLATKPKETITVSKSAANIMSLAGLSTTNGTSINGKTIKLDDNISIVASKGTSTSNPAYYSNAIRLYQNGATLTIKAAEGCTLKTIVITAASGGQGPISVTGGTASALSGGKYTITVNEGATEVVIKTTGTSSGTRVYLSNIEVIYEK